MSLFSSVWQGSLLSRERLLQAREFYAPAPAELTPELAFGRWTDRIAVQAELGSARELAGLTDEELAALEAEFVRCPQRPKRGLMRDAVPAGAVLASVGVAAIVWAAFTGGAGNYSLVSLIGIGWLVVGALTLGLGLLAGFSNMHLDLAHGTTGLFVGRLDEQHPWLYRASNLCLHSVAETYRQQVLRDRGPLRGVDYVMMREAVRAHEAVVQTQPARAVAEQLQQAPAAAIERRRAEPRLVRVAAVAEGVAAANAQRGGDPQVRGDLVG